MNKKRINLKSMLFYKIFIYSLLFTHLKSNAASIKNSKQLFNQQLIQNLMTYSKIAKNWSNWYLKSISNPTPKELTQNSLWYGINHGTQDSITRENPYKLSPRY